MLLLLLIVLLVVIWLTVPGHAAGQIIITAQDVGQPVITVPENAGNQPGYRASLYDTVWPADKANLNRSNSVVNAGLPRTITAETVAIESVEMPYPVFAYTRDEDEVFVIGGASFVLDRYVSEIDGMGDLGLLQGQSAPHITKYNPFTGEQTRLELDRGAGSGYVGGALVHANGYVYVVFQSHLYKIEPESMTIERSVDLPLAPGLARQFTIYNGLSTSSTGELITKYWSLVGEASSFFLIDPDWAARYDPYETGQEENEEPAPAPRATIASIIVSSANEVYFGNNEPGQPIGLFHRIYVP